MMTITNTIVGTVEKFSKNKETKKPTKVPILATMAEEVR
jgi:hypothetical protein